MRTTVVAIALTLGLLLARANAQTVYKCVAKGSPTSFQTAPCSSAQREVKAVNYTPDADVPYQPDIHERPYANKQSPRLTRRVTQGSGSACQQAKDRRDAWERSTGLSRTYKSLQAWNDRIRDACK